MLSVSSPPLTLKIFISYSRRDLQIADSFVAELGAQNFEVIIDRRNLPYGEEWQKELADFIRSSDTVLWLISEASLASKWVKWELGEVERLKKRLVPVRIASIDPDALRNRWVKFMLCRQKTYLISAGIFRCSSRH